MEQNLKPTSTVCAESKQVKAIGIVYGAFGNGEPEKCVGIVEDIPKPDTGGIFTKYIGCNYLFKGYPDTRVVSAISALKRILSNGLLLLRERIIQIFLVFPVLIFLLLPKSFKKHVFCLLVDYFISIARATFEQYFLSVERYCVSAKAIWIAFEKTINWYFDEGTQMRKRVEYLREIICVLWEYDYAYRARGQDVFPKLNKEALKENPVKELNRIIDFLIVREVGSTGMKHKFGMLKNVIWFVMRFKELREPIVSFFSLLDLEKIKPDEADWYYVLDRSDYNYGGLTHEERMKIKPELDKKVNNKLPKIIFKEVVQEQKK